VLHHEQLFCLVYYWQVRLIVGPL